jgi:hypothetical protein
VFQQVIGINNRCGNCCGIHIALFLSLKDVYIPKKQSSSDSPMSAAFMQA